MNLLTSNLEAPAHHCTPAFHHDKSAFDILTGLPSLIAAVFVQMYKAGW